MTAEQLITFLRAVDDEDFITPNIEIRVHNKQRIHLHKGKWWFD
jgi:hypothetical protein